jgi:hypothetical protein
MATSKSSRHRRPAAAATEYNLPGPQVEPGAAYWIRCPRPCPVSLDALRAITDDPANAEYFPPYPTDLATIDEELCELEELALLRDEPYRIQGTEKGRERLPLSIFLQLRPQPFGAAINTARDNQPPVLLTGRELARYFESEQPGLAHRLALDFLVHSVGQPFCDRGVSPPRAARMWAALDVAIYSALEAAWHYKWLATTTAGGIRPGVARRLRPVEARPSLSVLYDSIPNSTYSGDAGLHGAPQPSPGTPRHPAYPSGHSTYAGAGSEILSWFFPQYRDELDRLADNIGAARLWAGIHWRSDHVQGMKLGRVVARLVIDQLVRSGVPQYAIPPNQPPTQANLEKEARKFAAECGKAKPQPPPPCPPPRPC